MISAILVDSVTCELELHHHGETKAKTDAKIIPVENQRLSAPKWIQLTVAPVITGHKNNQSSTTHSESG
jgi:hypothetical protein